MSENLSPAQAAIAAAQAAAATQAQTAGPGVNTVPAVQNTTGTAVGAPVARGPAMTMETIGAGQMSVDAWVKVNEDGLKIGDKPDLLDELLVSLEFTDGVGFMVKYGIKGGNPAKYAYSTDGLVANDGKSWDMAIAGIRQVAPSANPYRCVDLPFRLEQDVEGKKSKAVIAAKGSTLGYTTSTTNWANWEGVYREVARLGLMGKRVTLKLTSQERKNNNGNIWGVIAFQVVGETLSDEAPD